MTYQSFYIAKYFDKFDVAASSEYSHKILPKWDLTCYRRRVFSEANGGALFV